MSNYIKRNIESIYLFIRQMMSLEISQWEINTIELETKDEILRQQR
jgi:hypothetical protein